MLDRGCFFLTTAARGDPAEIALHAGGQEPTVKAIAAALTSAKAALHTTQHGGYNNPEVDALLDKAIVPTDLAEQQTRYRKIQAITGVEPLIAPLFDQRTLIAAHPWGKGLPQCIAYAPNFETVYLEKHP